MNKKITHLKSGFTLIELLVVIAIIAILAAILFPVFARAREKARQTTCSSNQRQISVSVQMYAQDHESRLPAASEAWKVIAIDPAVLRCPTAGSSIVNAYGYNISMSGIAQSSIDSPDKAVLTADSSASDNILKSTSDLATRHSGQLIASYIDGHVQANTGTINFLVPTMDLFAGIGRSSMINDGQFGWSRLNIQVSGFSPFTTATADDFATYPAYFADITTGDGYPPPCLETKNCSLSRTIIPVNGSAAITSWVLSGSVKLSGGLWTNSSTTPDSYITITDSNATPKPIVSIGFFRICSTPDSTHATDCVKVNTNSLCDSEVMDGIYGGNSWPRYQNNWVSFSITATASGVYCQSGNGSVKVTPQAGSDWKTPSKITLYSSSGYRIDTLKFGDY